MYAVESWRSGDSVLEIHRHWALSDDVVDHLLHKLPKKASWFHQAARMRAAWTTGAHGFLIIQAEVPVEGSEKRRMRVGRGGDGEGLLLQTWLRGGAVVAG